MKTIRNLPRQLGNASRAKRIAFLIVVGVLIIAIGSFLYNTIATSHDHKVLYDAFGNEISHYTCPMHPQIIESGPGDCPICHMSLVPVLKDTDGMNGEGDEAITANTPTFRVDSQRQQLIGVRRATVERKEIETTIHTTGRVAFDPELAIAVREYLQVASGDPSLRRAAATRLRLLGMGDEEITALARNRNSYESLYSTSGRSIAWVYATIFDQESALIRPGQKATVTLASASGARPLNGIVRSISPNVDPITRSLTARVEVAEHEGLLRPDSFVNVAIAIDLGDELVVPRGAVLYSGTRNITFVFHSNTRLEVREVVTGFESEVEVVILSGLEEGEIVAASAAFLLDSESQLRASISSLGADSNGDDTPDSGNTGAAGGHNH